jgi:hypothetical protein
LTGKSIELFLCSNQHCLIGAGLKVVTAISFAGMALKTQSGGNKMEVGTLKELNVRETVTIYGAPSKHVQWCLEQCGLDTHRITFALIDGKPDLASIKMDELE